MNVKPLIDQKIVKLIQAVEPHKCIYDPEIKSRLIKDKAWESVSREIDTDVEECKKTWKSLQSSFRKALQKYNKSKEQGETYTPWKYWEHLQFLRKRSLTAYVEPTSPKKKKKSKSDKKQHTTPNSSDDDATHFTISTPYRPSPPNMSNGLSISAVDVLKQSSEQEETKAESDCDHDKTQASRMDGRSVADAFGELVAEKLKSLDEARANAAMRHIFNHLWSTT